MINIQLPTGKTISIPLHQFLFDIKEDEVDLFYQSCIADDLGVEINDPFANRSVKSRLITEDDGEIPEIPDESTDLEI